MRTAIASTPQRLLNNELTLLQELVPLQAQQIIELGCGKARLARDLLQACPQCHVTGLETDQVQHAANLQRPAERLTFVAGGAQAIPAPDASFDLAIMLKSLHHVPLEQMQAALAEVARVLRPGAYWYVSEPVYAGPLNDMVRLFNDEGTVRAAAQALLDQAGTSPEWERVADVFFDMPVHFRSFADFEDRMVSVSYAERHLDAGTRAQLQALFATHLGADGVHLVRPMHATLMRRR